MQTTPPRSSANRSLLMWLPVHPEQACLGDPFCRFSVSSRFSILRPKWHTLAVAYVLYGIGLTIYSFFSSNSLDQSGLDYLRFTDLEDAPFWLLSYWVFTPFAWFCYTWHPRYTSDLFKQLYKDKFIGRQKGKPMHSRTLQVLISAPLWIQLLVAMIMFAGACVGIWLFAWQFPPTCPSDYYCFGKDVSWFHHDTIFVRWFWTPLFAVAVTMLIMTLIRQVIITFILARLFRLNLLVPKLFHPDGHCGLEFVNRFVTYSTIIFVGSSFWLATLTFYPSIVNMVKQSPKQGVEMNVWLWSYYLIVGLASPFLWLPVRAIHRAINEAKLKHLKPIANKLREQIPRSGATFLAANKQDRNENIQLYKSISEAYINQPFPFYKNIGIIAPLVLALLSLILQILQSQ